MARRGIARAAKWMGGAIAAIVAVMVVRAALLPSRQPVVAPRAPVAVDAPKVARILATAIQKRTISESLEVPAPSTELAALRTHLEESFPLVHARLGREVLGEGSLLYTWGPPAGTAPAAILCAHLDVVPVEPGTEGRWTHPPFAGDVDDFVWGRGALDDKGSLVAILAAVESLARDGFVPRRPVLLAFGHDEEISGRNGAGRIVERLAAGGVRAEVVLDEGNPIVQGIVPSIAGPVAPVGVAEKGYLTLVLSVDLPGGHSSTPARESALGVLAGAVTRLRERPLPARLDGATREFFSWTAPEMSFGQRVVLANTWLTWPLVSRLFAKSPALDASIRTTTAPTVFHAGVKDNVVPRSAEARVNFRVLPGDSTDAVLAHARAVIDDARVRIEPVAQTRSEPTRVSASSGPAFGAIATAVREIFPGTVVAPALFLGATDGRQYERLADAVYRFQPVQLVSEDLARIHGTDERVTVTGIADAVRFYRRLLELLAGA